ERTRTIHPDTVSVRTEVAATGETIAAASAYDVALTAHDIVREEVGHIGANLDDLANKLVADRHKHKDGLLRPFVPLVDVNVDAADAVFEDANEHVVDADLGLLDILEPESGFAVAFDQSFHRTSTITRLPAQISGHRARSSSTPPLLRQN